MVGPGVWLKSGCLLIISIVKVWTPWGYWAQCQTITFNGIGGTRIRKGYHRMTLLDSRVLFTQFVSELF